MNRIYVEDHPQLGTTRTVVMFPGDTIRQFSSVIVMGWDHVVPKNSRAGSKNRAYKADFTEKEREILGRYHNKMYGWELCTGHPQEIGMTMATYALLKRAGDFFASI